MSARPIGWRGALLLIGLGTVGFLLPSLWRVLFVPSDVLAPALIARAQAEGAPPAFGARHATTTIVLFTDARCPVCRMTEAGLAETMRRDPRLRLVVRDWPILGPGSVAAARAALAARDEPAYAAFRTALLTTPGRLDPQSIDELAERSGLAAERLHSLEQVNKARIDATLGATGRLAGRLGLPGTPGLIVGDQLVKGGLDGWQLRRVLAAVRPG